MRCEQWSSCIVRYEHFRLQSPFPGRCSTLNNYNYPTREYFIWGKEIKYLQRILVCLQKETSIWCTVSIVYRRSGCFGCTYGRVTWSEKWEVPPEVQSKYKNLNPLSSRSYQPPADCRWAVSVAGVGLIWNEKASCHVSSAEKKISDRCHATSLL